MTIPHNSPTFYWAGFFTLSLRIVTGWTYFSAFWRRLVLEDKLDPETAGYIGEKFNHFLPNALGIQPLIEYLVTHPDALWWSMISFTIIEGIVGLFFMLGLFTRLMSIGVFGLAFGILLGAGWLGTTCLDEWQIGVLGLASGFTVFFTGGGKFALDNYLPSLKRNPLAAFLTSGPLPLSKEKMLFTGITGTLFITIMTLFTNQYFHGGVWGTLHNKSVKPKIALETLQYHNNALHFSVYRTEGADVYGSFLIGISLQDAAAKTVFALQHDELAAFPEEQIQNKHVAKIKPGKHSLVIPLGAKAVITLNAKEIQDLPRGAYTLVLTDISGIQWSKPLIIE